MGNRSTPARNAWEDQFQTPTVEELLAAYPKKTARLVESARERLLEYDSVAEEVSWQGLPWRWTLVYTRPDDPTRAWAYLVPDPETPRLAMPMTTEMVDAIPMRRLKKFVRDGIQTARRVGDMHWATWDVTSKTELDDVLDVVKRKHKFVTAKS